MPLPPTARRRGVSLLEVLVAIFVMAVGMLAIFTLFPLGAVNMAQALKDDRTRQTADQADAFLRMYWRGSVATPAGAPARDGRLVNSLLDPNASPASVRPPDANNLPGQLDYGGGPVAYPPAAAGPSYPVLVDPLAYFARAGQNRHWVAREGARPPAAPVLLPRRNLGAHIDGDLLPPVKLMERAVETCMLLDDMTFAENGAPVPGLERQGRYSWAALVQRPRHDEPAAALSVLVFEGRPPLLAGPGDEAMLSGAAVAGWVEGARSVTLAVPTRTAEQAPLVRKGGWVLDGTIDPANNVRNGRFYRIAGVTEGAPDPATNTTPFVLDLQTPVAGAGPAPQLYLFAYLSEVFERPPLGPDGL